VREPEKVERLWLAHPTLRPTPGRVAAELDQPCLVRVQRQPELREPVAQLGQELPRLLFIFEPDHDVVGESHDDHVTVSTRLSPVISP